MSLSEKWRNSAPTHLKGFNVLCYFNRAGENEVTLNG